MDSSTPHQHVRFTLTAGERDLVVNHALALDKDLASKLRFAVIDCNRLAFTLSEEDFSNLLDAVASEAGHTSPRSLRRQFSALYERLSRTSRNHASAGMAPDGEPFRSLPAELHKDIERLLQTRDFNSIEAVNRAIQTLTDAHNRRPRAEFDGLSPDQVWRLVYCDWESGASVVRLNTGIPMAELEHVEILKNARVFLQSLLESQGAKTTVAGNLNRKFVVHMLHAMHWLPGYVEALWRYSKVLNEEDVFPLHTIRIVADLAGLIRKREGFYRVTSKGQTLCQEMNAGKLFALLFRTFFQKFNLAYLDRIPGCAAVQHTVGYSFYMLARHATDWQTPEDLAARLFLPSVLAALPTSPLGGGYEVSLARNRVFRPLERFWANRMPVCGRRPRYRPGDEMPAQDSIVRPFSWV